MNVPLRSKLFLWRMLHDVLPVRINLEKRGVLVNPLCPQCLFAKETNFHVFLDVKVYSCFGSYLRLAYDLNLEIVMIWVIGEMVY